MRVPVSAPTIQRILDTLTQGRSLTREEMRSAVEAMSDGVATSAQIAALLTALKMKGETPVELAAAAEALREKVVKVRVQKERFIDTCGTGGDGLNTFNISTAAALVVAAAGVPVAKHGNRAASSRCGSADVLAELGVNIDATRETVERCIAEVGVGFLFVPHYHPAFKSAQPVRRELGFRTLFNFLGPLLNPAGARRQVMGVSTGAWVRKLGEVQQILGAEHVWVVHGGGLDELSVLGPTQVCEVRDGSLRDLEVTPEEVGLRRWPLESLRGGEASDNARVLRNVLEGERGGPRDAVVLNAGAGLLVGGKVPTLEAGARLAERVIDDGSALRTLESLIRVSSSGSGE